MFRIIVGGVLGAIVAFVWSFVSWMVLPWHNVSMNKFTNQEFVSWVVKENAPKSGVYVAPYYDSKEANLTPEEIKQSFDKEKAAFEKGPFIFAQVNLKGMDPSNPWTYVFSFLTQFVGAALISWLLLQTSFGYGKRLMFVTVIGLLVGVLGFVPDWNWFGAGYKFTLVMIADLIATWFLAGIVLAAYVKPRGEHQRELMM
ncbi:MAG: hypothetical protein KFB93_07740 [Simkaniaceae bacterium]|nr:MAG: hypothetical protein KFB93_07740 [Simkaniaceae bacterium]